MNLWGHFFQFQWYMFMEQFEKWLHKKIIHNNHNNNNNNNKNSFPSSSSSSKQTTLWPSSFISFSDENERLYFFSYLCFKKKWNLPQNGIIHFYFFRFLVLAEDSWRNLKRDSILVCDHVIVSAVSRKSNGHSLHNLSQTNQYWKFVETPMSHGTRFERSFINLSTNIRQKKLREKKSLSFSLQTKLNCSSTNMFIFSATFEPPGFSFFFLL